MRPRPSLARLLLVLLAVAVAAPSRGGAEAQSPGGGAGGAGGAAETAPARRIVSMNPSLTQTLVALGATSALVGVDAWSARQLPEARDLPMVGGLFNPSLESVVALEPDLVVLVPSEQQRDLRARLEALGVAVLELPNITLEQLLASIEILGARVGRAGVARRRVAEIQETWSAVTRATFGRPRVKGVLVLQRDPLFVVGRGSFIDSMLGAAGVENAAAVFPEPYPRVALEWLIRTAPSLLLDSSDDPEQPRSYWSRWPSLPAVAAGRVVALDRGSVTLPGPYVDRALRTLAEAVHGPSGPPAPGSPAPRELPRP